MPNHGTAFEYNLGQSAEVNYAIGKSLAHVLPGFDPKEVLKALGSNTGQLNHLMTGVFASLLGNVSPARTETVVPVLEPEVGVIYRDFPTWKTIRTGKYKDVSAIQKAFKKLGCKISDWAKDIIGKPTFNLSQQEQDVELVAVSGRDLGFTKNVNRAEIYERSTTIFKLDLCQPEDGVYLREQYLDQANGEWRLIAMEPIAGSEGGLLIFDVRRGGDLWLHADYGKPGNLWSPGSVWVFRRRK